MVQQFIRENVWETNWKCLIENIMEGYHMGVVHSNSLNKITPTRLCKKIPGGEGYTAYKSYYNPDYPTRMPYHEDVTDDEKRYSLMFCVYPSHGVALSSNGVGYKCLRPRSGDQVVLRWGYASFNPKPRGQGHHDDNGSNGSTLCGRQGESRDAAAWPQVKLFYTK